MLRQKLTEINWEGRISKEVFTSLLAAAKAEVLDRQTDAIKVDERLDTLRLLLRSLGSDERAFTSPIAVKSGGRVRETAGAVTLPELWYTDALRTTDGVLRSTLKLIEGTGEVSASDSDIAAFDADSATSWELQSITAVPPILTIPGIGTFAGSQFTIEIEFDSPQTISQLEIGTLGEGIQILRIYEAANGNDLIGDPAWADPGALLFFTNRVTLQRLRLLVCQPHGVPIGNQWLYRVWLHTIRVGDAKYPASGIAIFADRRVPNRIIRPEIQADGNAILQVKQQDWEAAPSAFTPAKVSQQETLAITVNGWAYLSYTPDQITSVVFRSQGGVSRTVNSEEILQMGASLMVINLTESGSLIVNYTHEPQTIELAAALTRSGDDWTSPIVLGVKL
jgi:hypothetical protein